MKPALQLTHLLALLALASLLGCGGGGATPPSAVSPVADEQDPPPPPPPPPAPPPPPLRGGDYGVRFVDVTDDAGVTTAHDVTRLFGVNYDPYEVTGQAWCDIDNDGWVDVYLTNPSGANRLWMNKGDGTFEASAYAADVEASADLSGGALFFDYDNDGWRDLYLLNQGPNRLYRNLQGAGFQDVTAGSGLDDPRKGVTASAGDYDNDGDLDVYVCNWACWDCVADNSAFQGNEDRLFRNDGAGVFTDVSDRLGRPFLTGYGFTGSFVDYDNDGDLDIYLVNDKGQAGPDVQPLNRNALFRNDGDSASGWVWTEVAISAGADARVYGMGLAIGDVDGDLALDLAFTDGGPARLLHNNGDATFSDVSIDVGFRSEDLGWGICLTDWNRDGALDSFIACSPKASTLLLNEGDGTFRDDSAASGFDYDAYTMGCAACDYDQDGWPDLMIGEWGSKYRLFRNTGLRDATQTAGGWVSFRCVGGGAINRDAIGARVTVHRSDGVVAMQEVKSGSSIGSGEDTALFFGLSDADVDFVDVLWPDGSTTQHTGISAGGVRTLSAP